MGANVRMAEAMGETSKTMAKMNKVMDPAKVAGTMKEFEMANAKMAMSEEVSKCRSFMCPCRPSLAVHIFHIK